MAYHKINYQGSQDISKEGKQNRILFFHLEPNRYNKHPRVV